MEVVIVCWLLRSSSEQVRWLDDPTCFTDSLRRGHRKNSFAPLHCYSLSRGRYNMLRFMRIRRLSCPWHQVVKHMPPGAPIMSVSKGIETSTLMLMNDILKEVCGQERSYAFLR